MTGRCYGALFKTVLVHKRCVIGLCFKALFHWRRVRLFDCTAKRLQQYGRAHPWLWAEAELWNPAAAAALGRHRQAVRRAVLRSPERGTGLVLLGGLVGGAVEELELDLSDVFLHTSALAALPRLRQLTVDGGMEARLTLGPELSVLTSLTQLWLADLQLIWRGNSALPPNLVRLAAEEAWNGSLPPAIAALSALRQLQLRGCGVLDDFPAPGDQGSTAGLEKLRALTSLSLSALRLGQLPPELPVLTRLRALELAYFPGQAALQYPWAALQRQLTALALLNCHLEVLPEQLPALSSLRGLDLSRNLFASAAALDGLSRLSRLSWLSLASCKLRELPPVVLHLPELKVGGPAICSVVGGPWQELCPK